MKTPLIVALSLVLVLGACQSRLNPFNWFGRSAPVEKVVLTEGEAVDPRLLVDEVLSLDIESFPGGAIIRAEGRNPTQGYWDAELVARPVDENGVLVFDFRVFPPVTDQPASTVVSREVVVATFVSDIRLAQVASIVVQGETNSLSPRR